MAFSLKRLNQLRKGQVVFNIYDDTGALVESCPKFLIAVQRIDFLQQIKPAVKFDIKVELEK